MNLATAGKTCQAFCPLQKLARLRQNNLESKENSSVEKHKFSKKKSFFRPCVPPCRVLSPPIKFIAGHAALHALLFWHAQETQSSKFQIYCSNKPKNSKNFLKFPNRSVSPAVSSTDYPYYSVLEAGGEPSTWPPPGRLGKPFCFKMNLE